MMQVLDPNLSILPASQLRLWPELHATPSHFTLYGGTALALRLGHRTSIDFDFFSYRSFDPDQLVRSISYLRDAETVQVAPNTLSCRIEAEGFVAVSFFGGLDIGQVAPRDIIPENSLHVASLLDIAGTKAAVIQKRSEVKDYLDIDAILRSGVDLPTLLAAGKVVYGKSFNPLITLKALSYFEDVHRLPLEVKRRLHLAVEHFSWGEKLPRFKAYRTYGTSQDYKDEATPPQS